MIELKTLLQYKLKMSLLYGHLKLSKEYKFVDPLFKLYSVDIIVNTIAVHHTEWYVTFKVSQVLLFKCVFAKHAEYIFTVVNGTWGLINLCKLSLEQLNYDAMFDVHSMHRLVIAQLLVGQRES